MAFSFFGCATQKPSLIVTQNTDKTGAYTLKYKSSYPEAISAGHLFWNASKLTLENGYKYFVPAFYAYNKKTQTSSVLVFMGKGNPPQIAGIPPQKIVYLPAQLLMGYIEKEKFKMPLQKENSVDSFNDNLRQLVGGLDFNPNGN